jgi:hypothetical protein
LSAGAKDRSVSALADPFFKRMRSNPPLLPGYVSNYVPCPGLWLPASVAGGSGGHRGLKRTPLASTPPARPSSATERSRRYRQRRRKGTRCITVQVNESGVGALVARGYLPKEACGDPSAIGAAIEVVFSDLETPGRADSALVEQQDSRDHIFGHACSGGPAHFLQVEAEIETIRHGAGNIILTDGDDGCLLSNRVGMFKGTAQTQRHSGRTRPQLGCGI